MSKKGLFLLSSKRPSRQWDVASVSWSWFSFFQSGVNKKIESLLFTIGIDFRYLIHYKNPSHFVRSRLFFSGHHYASFSFELFGPGLLLVWLSSAEIFCLLYLSPTTYFKQERTDHQIWQKDTGCSSECLITTAARDYLQTELSHTLASTRIAMVDRILMVIFSF